MHAVSSSTKRISDQTRSTVVTYSHIERIPYDGDVMILDQRTMEQDDETARGVFYVNGVCLTCLSVLLS